ncbi:MAG: hypothetical protein SFU85_06435 [Candidatus Methylacidiphilales bacterium]|nr:hypothetical protein [Candidatus Methylacidiphilales bacterium]
MGRPGFSVISEKLWILLPLVLAAVACVLWMVPRPSETRLLSSSPAAGPASQVSASRPVTPADDGASSLYTRQEKDLSALIVSSRSTESKAAELLRLLPELPGDIQELAARHLANLASDEQMMQAVRLMADPRIQPPAQDAILNGVYNRDPLDAAALCIEILKNGPETRFLEAERTLSVLLQADHGRDTAAWTREWKAARSNPPNKPSR